MRFLFPFCLVAALSALCAASAADSPADATPLLGFTRQNSVDERKLEHTFDRHLDSKDLRRWVQRMSAKPNQVGSPHDKANAEFVLHLFQKWGWEAHLETFRVLYPTPRAESLELVAPSHFVAQLHEPPLKGDRTSGENQNVLPPYNAYGADGDVTARLVYVNYGMPDDYKQLDRLALSVRGCVVIARYGGGWRGLKPKLAQQHGAVGCLIYSDPRDDGYWAGDPYPVGGYRPAEGVQRGSVADMPVYAGDPLTPGVGATATAPRLSRQRATTLLRIPVLPLAAADARPLLAALKGPVAPPNWRGALPFTYHVGPGPAVVHLKVQSDWDLKPIYDVIAVLKGSVFPDQWIVRGNHHDGWVFGAWDPLSAHAALLAEAKAIGTLARTGWRPKRTLVYASWDGEEPGLLGSTEWAEEHAAELRRKAVLYVNSDSVARGFLFWAGSHTLQHFLNQVAGDVPDPETKVSIRERLRRRRQVQAYLRHDTASLAKGSEASRPDLPLGALGSGSDYTPFLQHLGIASVNLGFGGEDQDSGIYHSLYDSFDHYLRFGDPDFAYGVALAKTAGRIVLRAADADVLPLEPGDFATTVAGYAREIHRLADTMRARTEALQQLLRDHAFRLAADPRKTEHPPVLESSVPFLNLAPLDNAVTRLRTSARAYAQAYGRSGTRRLIASHPKQQARLNRLLGTLEQTLLDPQGLPSRPWYRHLVYAPGLYTGYGVKTLPAVRETIEQRRWRQVDSQVTRTAGALQRFARQLDQATALLNSVEATKSSAPAPSSKETHAGHTPPS